MKTIEMIVYKREDLSTQYTKQLRKDAMVPCVLYGPGDNLVHFSMPMILFRDLIYTPEVFKIDMNIEGEMYHCILQDAQFHPVSEYILHADFLLLDENRPVKMEVPVKFVGTSPGVQSGGRLMSKVKKIKVKALPADLPEFIEVDISNLTMGKSVKIKEIQPEKYEIMMNSAIPIASVEIPRALRSKQESEGEEEAEVEAEI